MTERETESPAEPDDREQQPDGAEGWEEPNDEPAEGENGQVSFTIDEKTTQRGSGMHGRMRETLDDVISWRRWP